MPASDELVDGATVPWDFILSQTSQPKAPSLPPPVRREPLPVEQTARRRLIAAGRWRRP